jgi:hypothetical protein
MGEGVEELPLTQNTVCWAYPEPRFSLQIALEILELGYFLMKIEMPLNLLHLLLIPATHTSPMQLPQLLIAVYPHIILLLRITHRRYYLPNPMRLAQRSYRIPPLPILRIPELLAIPSLRILDIQQHPANQVELLFVPGVPVDFEDGPRDDLGSELGELVLGDVELFVVEGPCRDVEVDTVGAVFFDVV